MSRNDAHLDAMLRHLGAAYYDSLHGRAAQADVTRALDSVAGQLGEEFPKHPGAASTGQPGPGSKHHQHHGRWHSRVRDVMTTSVVTVDRITSYKEIARLLTEHRISGMPVLTMGRHVAGVVTEGDLLAARVRSTGGRWPRWLTSHQEHQGLVASQLMTSPAITIHPDAALATAAALMSAHHLRRLPVVDPEGKLLGIVSRRDLLSVFLRPDAEIAHQVREIVAEVLPGGPAGVEVAVRSGVVTLTGEPELPADNDLVQVAVRLIRDVDGVVDAIDKTGPAAVPASR